MTIRRRQATFWAHTGPRQQLAHNAMMTLVTLITIMTEITQITRNVKWYKMWNVTKWCKWWYTWRCIWWHVRWCIWWCISIISTISTSAVWWWLWWCQLSWNADADAWSMTPSRNDWRYTLRSVQSSPGRSFLDLMSLHLLNMWVLPVQNLMTLEEATTPLCYDKDAIAFMWMWWRMMMRD